MKIFVCLIVLTTLLSCTQSQEQQLPPENTVKACSKEAKVCADGKVVGRNPIHDCNFDPCSNKLNSTQKKNHSKAFCTADVKQCPDGTFVGRDANNNCQFSACTGSNLQ